MYKERNIGARYRGNGHSNSVTFPDAILRSPLTYEYSFYGTSAPWKHRIRRTYELRSREAAAKVK